MNIMENGQGKVSFLDHLDHCCQLVADTYGKSDSAEWTNSDFIKLSSILYKKTHVQISPNTLKRIFGKIKTDARYYPQRATRDALVRYVGYSDWDTFTSKQLAPQPMQPHGLSDIQPTKPTYEPEIARQHRRFPARWMILSAVGLVAALLLLWRGVQFWRKEGAPVSLLCTNPEGDNPHSAVFVLRGFGNLSDLADGYEIDFGDGDELPLSGKDSVYSHYYETPGRFFAKLKKHEITIDTVPVFLHTNGWTATANMMHDTTRVYPIEGATLFENGRNSISVNEIARAGVDTNRTFFVDFVNTHLTGIDGDNFELFLDVKTSLPRPGVRCSQVRLTVYGDSSSHMVDIMKPGCVHWSKLQLSEINESGRSNGLDFLGADLVAGGTVQMKVVNRKATLFINGKEVYKNTYKKPLRHIYGLDIMFAGIGTVRSVQLKDLKTGRQFSGNF
ncbi:hypothetical protein [Dyadobacter sp. MSC1_007]|jgi:hypothetical protein|uniref:hypothetical protein n=1 Tax=Dyadobacter sp. MSC1_007 TaxID=2909264 RepID=UPI00202FCAC6|nr:hypothetical protein [Dyadobacter sp. MSC1_007]